MNKTKLSLVIGNKIYDVEFESDCIIAHEILTNLPFSGEVVNVQGEIFYLINTEIPYSPCEGREVFEVGDIVYWKSLSGDMTAIALFYGNTVYENGNQPRGVSPCIKIGSIKELNIDDMHNMNNGEVIKLIKR